MKKLQEIDLIKPACVVHDGLLRAYNLGVTERNLYINEKIYALKDPKMIYNLLIKNQNSFSEDNTVDSMIEWIEYVFSDGGFPRKIQTFNSSIDNIAEVLNELFPSSFCA